MSWPRDGRPRYVTGSIDGGEIGGAWEGGRNAPEWYIYDRAHGYRIVYRKHAGGSEAKAAVAVASVKQRCAVLNDAHEAQS